jgi:hypothetical protein
MRRRSNNLPTLSTRGPSLAERARHLTRRLPMFSLDEEFEDVPAGHIRMATDKLIYDVITRTIGKEKRELLTIDGEDCIEHRILMRMKLEGLQVIRGMYHNPK